MSGVADAVPGGAARPAVEARLVYLDQNWWGRLATDTELRDVRAHLEVAVDAGVVRCPVGLERFLETLSVKPEIRAMVRQVMRRLSCGWYVEDPSHVMRLEYEGHRDGQTIQSMRRRMHGQIVLAKEASDPLAVLPRNLGSPAASAAHLLLNQPDEFIDGPRMLAAKNAAFDHAATTASVPGAVSTREAIADALQVDPSELRDFPECLPSLAVRERLISAIRAKVPSGVEPNDIPDVTALSIALPYFDLVATDRKMCARIRDAKLDRTGAVCVCDPDAFREELLKLGAG